MRIASICVLSLTLGISAFSSHTHAAVIYENPITGTNPNTANPYTTGQTVVLNLAGSGIGRGSGAIGTNANDRYNANSWNTPALDPTAYFDWTLTPSSGYQIDFDSLKGSWQRSGTGPNSYALRSSLDGYAADIASGDITGSATVVPYDLNLSGAAFDAVDAPITFRLYAWGAAAGASGGTFSINDFAFHGEVLPVDAIPEPGSACLVLLAAAAFLGVRRVTG